MRVYKSDPSPLGSVRPAGLNDFHSRPAGFWHKSSANGEEVPLTSSSKDSPAGGKGQKRKNDDRR